jgi:penicillin-binding protein 1A
VKKAVKKKDARPFKVADNITMMVVDPLSGKKSSFASKKTIIEAFKNNQSKIKDENTDINNRFKNNNILRFY